MDLGATTKKIPSNNTTRSERIWRNENWIDLDSMDGNQLESHQMKIMSCSIGVGGNNKNKEMTTTVCGMTPHLSTFAIFRVKHDLFPFLFSWKKDKHQSIHHATFFDVDFSLTALELETILFKNPL